MSMQNSNTDFYGKQEDEKILYVVRPHPLATVVSLIKIYLIALAVFFVLFLLGTQLLVFSGGFALSGLILAFLIIVFGTKIVTDYQKRNIAYITDRRLVRFEPTTLFATNPRSLTWDEVVKVKTYPPNFMWKQLAVGNVVVHARTPARPDESFGGGGITADDILLNHVFYYRDLGNYIDKILFTYKQKPKEMDDIKPFVPKPRGERY